MRFTPCDCSAPGWCERHVCDKSARQYYLCRMSEVWFEGWETGTLQAADARRPLIRRLPLERCEHRSAEFKERISCDLCGMENRRIPVYECQLHSECSEQRIGTRTERLRAMAICLTCDDYKARTTQSE